MNCQQPLRREMITARIPSFTLTAFLAITSFHGRADAAAVIKITEVGGNVVVSAAGSLNTEALTFSETSNSAAGIDSTSSFLEVSTGPTDIYTSISGPSSFGTGSFTFPSSGSGNRFGIRVGVAGLSVPKDYVSGTPLSGTSTFNNKTFAQLGLTPGFYIWTWGSGGTADSLSIKVVDVPTPIQATLEINANQNPVLRWEAELGCRYSISSSIDLENYVTIAKGFPFDGATATNLTFTDLPMLTGTSPKAFYRVEKDPISLPKSTDELAAFFTANGGKAGFSDLKVKALETVLFALDEIEAGQLVAARTRVDAMLAAYPLSTGGWYSDSQYRGLNLGDPVGYYAIRMLDQILTLGNPSRAGKLRMTAVIGAAATVTRPTLPNFAPETVQRVIAPEILADDARRLHLVSRLFRRWVQAITGGLEVELAVHVVEQGTTVNFTREINPVVGGTNTVFSTANVQEMIDTVPASLASTTNLWWVMAPSGVPGDGTGFNSYFITGGMGSDSSGIPVISCDDSSFTRKPSNLGSGPYSEVELRMYHPSWLQHEFMHHLFSLYPEFGLENTAHQWFYPVNWPSDFVGNNEPDYYIEALTKRILTATPSVADQLKVKKYADMSTFPKAKLLGTYQRKPVQNAWHNVTISLNGGNLRWNNSAPLSWGLEIIGTELWSLPEGPYGAQRLRVQLDANDDVVSINIGGERFIHVTTPANTLMKSLTTNLVSESPIPAAPFFLLRRPQDGATNGCKKPDHHHCLSCLRP